MQDTAGVRLERTVQDTRAGDFKCGNPVGSIKSCTGEGIAVADFFLFILLDCFWGCSAEFSKCF
jgi:hypothetical protein